MCSDTFINLFIRGPRPLLQLLIQALQERLVGAIDWIRPSLWMRLNPGSAVNERDGE